MAKIRESHEYTTSTIYWLGGKFSIYDEWKWVDNTSIVFNGKQGAQYVPLPLSQANVKYGLTQLTLGLRFPPPHPPPKIYELCGAPANSACAPRHPLGAGSRSLFFFGRRNVYTRARRRSTAATGT